jgi:hypothetical protein
VWARFHATSRCGVSVRDKIAVFEWTGRSPSEPGRGAESGHQLLDHRPVLLRLYPFCGFPMRTSPFQRQADRVLRRLLLPFADGEGGFSKQKGEADLASPSVLRRSEQPFTEGQNHTSDGQGSGTLLMAAVPGGRRQWSLLTGRARFHEGQRMWRGPVAQWIEQLFTEGPIVGSNPIGTAAFSFPDRKRRAPTICTVDGKGIEG